LSEYSAKVGKEELIYTFEQGVLYCDSSSPRATSATFSIDLNSIPVTVSHKKGLPSQFMFSVFALVMGTGVGGYMGINYFLKGDSIGVFAAVFGWVMIMAVIGYGLLKYKKHKYLSLKAKDKSGINIIFNQPEKSAEYEAFVQEIQGFVEMKLK